MNDPTQERSGRQDNRLCSNRASIGKHNTANATALDRQVDNFALNNPKVLCALQLCQHTCSVDFAVCLGTRPLHRGSFPSVQQPELDPGRIRDPSHHAVQRVNLPHQVSFTQATNGRIAGHYPNAILAERYQNGPRAKARGSCRGFTAGVATPDHNNIDVGMFHVKHLSLPNAETRKDIVQQGFDIHTSD